MGLVKDSCCFGNRCVRLPAPVAPVRRRDERGHQLAIADRPRGGPAYCLMVYSLYRSAVKVGPIPDQVDANPVLELTRHRANDHEQGLGAKTVAADRVS